MELELDTLKITFSFGAPAASVWTSSGRFKFAGNFTPKQIKIETPQKDKQAALNRTVQLIKTGASYSAGKSNMGCTITLTPSITDVSQIEFTLQMRQALDGTLNSLLCDNQLTTNFSKFGYRNETNKAPKIVNLPVRFTVDGQVFETVVPTQYTSSLNVMGEATFNKRN